MADGCKHYVCTLAVLNLLVLSSMVSAQSAAGRESKVELRIRPSQFANGVPETISFVFVNLADHAVRIPPVSPCIGRYSGILKLKLDFSPVGPKRAGQGGGCGGAVDHAPGILKQAESWKRLKPGESLTLSYKRTELFVFEQAPGAYEFWGEYQPPPLTAADVAILEQAGVDFLREPLKSTPLRFNRTE